MRILSLRLSEEIVIGGNVRVMIVEIRQDRVKIGVKAPREITVNRAEIQSKIDASKITYDPTIGEDYA